MAGRGGSLGTGPRDPGPVPAAASLATPTEFDHILAS